MVFKDEYNELDIALMSEKEAYELVRAMIQGHPYDPHPEADEVARMVVKLKPGVKAIMRYECPAFQTNSLALQLGTMFGMTTEPTGRTPWTLTWAKDVDTKPT